MTRFYQRTVVTFSSLALVHICYHFCNQRSPFLSLRPCCEDTFWLVCVLWLNSHCAQKKITVSSVLPLKRADSWNKDSSFPFNKFISSWHWLLSLLLFRSSYLSFLSLGHPGSHCTDSNTKRSLPPAFSSTAAVKRMTGCQKKSEDISEKHTHF